MAWRSILIIALIAALMIAYSLWSRRGNEGLVDQPAVVQVGSYYLQDASMIETDASGAARFKLRARQIDQDPGTKGIDLQQVQLDYQSAPDAKWLLTADRAHLVTDSRIIDFTGNVHIKPRPPSDNPVELHTETLSVDTEKHVATAPGKVDFAMDRQYLTAVGMKYDLKHQTLQLESRLHGQFQAN